MYRHTQMSRQTELRRHITQLARCQTVKIYLFFLGDFRRTAGFGLPATGATLLGAAETSVCGGNWSDEWMKSCSSLALLELLRISVNSARLNCTSRVKFSTRFITEYRFLLLMPGIFSSMSCRTTSGSTPLLLEQRTRISFLNTETH